MKLGRNIYLAVSICVASVLLIAFGWMKFQNASNDRVTTINPLPSINDSVDSFSDNPIQPIFAIENLNANKVALGERLFHDPRLSSNNSVSCASCHNLNQGGDDGRPGSIGIHGSIVTTNSPTVFNASLNIAQFWDGRVDTLEEQIDGPIHDLREMGSNWPQIIDKLNQDVSYVSSFHRLYSDGITEANLKYAISTFEQSLTTVNSPFDKFLKGDLDAIDANVKQGYEKFKEYGCVACHQGRNVGGNMYQPLGIMGDYFADRGTEITKSDLGRFNVTGREADKYVFRVPSLRLAPLTAPYLHDGSAATLRDAVRVMIKYQIGRSAPVEDEDLIIDFINSLVGEYKGKRLIQ